MKGKATPPEVIEKIKVAIAMGYSEMEVGRQCGVANTTVHTIMDRIYKDEVENKKFEELRKQKQEEMQRKASEDFDKQMNETFEDLFEKAKTVISNAYEQGVLSPRDALTLLGVSFDKRQLLKGKSTSNVSVSFDDILKEINKGNEF